jgi:hypothetical protein
MGKGKRNRERRKRQAGLSQEEAAALLGLLIASTEEGQFLDLLRRRPVVLSDQMLDHLERMRDLTPGAR